MFRVLENMQIMKIETPFNGCIIETPIGMAKADTKVGEYENVDDIIIVDVPVANPVKTLEEKVDDLQNTVSIILLKQEGLL